MRAGSSYRPPTTRLSPRARSLAMTITHAEDLMKLTVPMTLLLLACPHYVILHFIFSLHQSCSRKPWRNHLLALYRLPNTLSSLMPRERGKPRRGSTWHSYAARRKRMQELERALSIARTQLQRIKIEGNAPPVAEVIMEPPTAAIIVEPLVAAIIVEPSAAAIILEPLAVAVIKESAMAYIIEEIPKEPFQETSELFTVPKH